MIQREEGKSDKMRNEGEMMKRATERRVKVVDDLIYISDILKNCF